MGSCISKCRTRPKKHSLKQEFDHVQDKLVISQSAPKTPYIPPSNKISPSPPSPTPSTSSISSLTCTTSNTTTSSSSLSSSSSSVLSSKDRSFSNEFLWSCIKDNPHIIRINSIKESSAKFHAQKSHSSLAKQTLAAPAKQSIPQNLVRSSVPQKRVRSSSPTPLTRQKSFRKEPEKLIPSRTLRSPSPSRRFNGDKYGGLLTNTRIESHSKRMPSSRRENYRSASPDNNSRHLNLPCLRNGRETFTHRIGSKIDEIAVGKALSYNDVIDSIPLEDIDNPLISLDCFIFL